MHSFSDILNIIFLNITWYQLSWQIGWWILVSLGSCRGWKIDDKRTIWFGSGTDIFIKFVVHGQRIDSSCSGLVWYPSTINNESDKNKSAPLTHHISLSADNTAIIVSVYAVISFFFKQSCHFRHYYQLIWDSFIIFINFNKLYYGKKFQQATFSNNTIKLPSRYAIQLRIWSTHILPPYC